MAQQTFDPSSKWMLEEQGASILYIAGERRVVACKARKAEVVRPAQVTRWFESGKRSRLV